MEDKISCITCSWRKRNSKNKKLKFNCINIKNEFKLQMAYFSQLYENSFEAVAILNNQDEIISINKSFTKIFKYELNEVVGKSINEVIADRKLTKDAFDISKIVLQGGFVSRETTRKRKDGQLVNVKMTAFPIIVSNTQIGIYAVYEDITEQKVIEKALKEQKEWLKVTLSSIGDGVIATDREGKINFMNNAAAELTGHSVTEAEGSALTDIFNVSWGKSYDDDSERKDLILMTVINEGKTFKSEENVQLISKDKKAYNISISAAPIQIEGGKSIGMVITFQNITDRVLMEEKLIKMSLYDSLTEVYNRTYFHSISNEHDSKKSQNLGLILCDLDGLKIINDTLGHFVGDELLIATTEVLKKACGSNCIVARIGGDEFVVVLKNTSKKEIEELNSKIENEIKTYNKNNNRLHLSISKGIAFSGQTFKSMKDIFKQADNDMYICKLHNRESNRNAIMKTMIKALKETDFVTEGHIERMKKISVAFAANLGLPKKIINSIGLLAEFHDIGKVGVSSELLQKPGMLNEEEKKELKRHSEIGYRIAKHATALEHIAELILKHHEAWDGNGYPIGLKGVRIPIECRIISIVDAYDAMTSNRPYKKTMSKREAIEELKKCGGVQFDPELVDKFIKYLKP